METMQTLEEFISQHFESKADFARQLGIFPQQITQWQNGGYMVNNGIMYRPMRQIADMSEA